MVLAVAFSLTFFLMAVGLIVQSWPILKASSVRELLLSDVWRPHEERFGFLPFILGTLWVTGISVILAIPLCLLTAVFLSEYAHRRIREAVMPLVDLLAGIPSVIYGVWGFLVIVPLIKDRIAPAFGTTSTGYCVLAGGMVLAIMIFPVIINVMLEVFRAVPHEMRTAALALGATRWQMVKSVVLRKAMPGIVAACVLGFSRAFGETMAVLMVVGNRVKIPKSPFDAGYPLPALIANKYGETASDPLYASALLLSALILLGVVFGFNALARVILVRVEKLAQ